MVRSDCIHAVRGLRPDESGHYERVYSLPSVYRFVASWHGHNRRFRRTSHSLGDGGVAYQLARVVKKDRHGGERKARHKEPVKEEWGAGKRLRAAREGDGRLPRVVDAEPWTRPPAERQ